MCILWTSNGLIRVRGHTRRPIRSNAAAPVPVALSNDRHPRADVSHCLDWDDKDTKPPLFRMHESKSWGQVHQSVKEGGGRRQNGGMETGRGKRGVKANGFVATVIIRLTKNPFSSRRTEAMLGNEMKQVFTDVFRSCDADTQMCLQLLTYTCAFLCSLYDEFRAGLLDFVESCAYWSGL